ncbi:MAG TPA: isochorismatase family protein, partial [Chthoniobacterales bacterium]
MNPLLLLVDFQGDYLNAPGLEPAAGAVVERAAALLAGARAAGLPVAHVWTTVRPEDDRRMPHWKTLGKWLCVEGTPGHAPPEPLRPLDSEPVIHKRFFSAFSSGTLGPLLAER